MKKLQREEWVLGEKVLLDLRPNDDETISEWLDWGADKLGLAIDFLVIEYTGDGVTPANYSVFSGPNVRANIGYGPAPTWVAGERTIEAFDRWFEVHWSATFASIEQQTTGLASGQRIAVYKIEISEVR